MALWTDSGNGPSPSRRGLRRRLSGTAVVLGGCTSAAVIYAAARGEFTLPIALAAGVGACLIAAISTRRARTVGALLPPLARDGFGPVVIDAPRASTVAGHAGSRSDAA